MYFEVADALLVSCYEERHMIEDMHHGLLAMEVSHAMDREELRMSKVALAAAKRIQQVAGGRCACGEQLSPRASARGARPVLLTLVRPGLGTLCLIRGAGPAGPVGLTGRLVTPWGSGASASQSRGGRRGPGTGTFPARDVLILHVSDRGASGPGTPFVGMRLSSTGEVAPRFRTRSRRSPWAVRTGGTGRRTSPPGARSG
ncbi:hypothetical protein Shyd_69100 [Streptomyces hydrogenans]|uniref:Uncharacterized protein n=1 Tax=Streptomyces hydrogenans TaxID=1873719 RepID=A0ABQ3PKJ3_9ACTN|nr:hypothetical protein Shyd_69100 [Streptomyces hydrogenans]